jgi:uncharacterized spore protein YtfJ
MATDSLLATLSERLHSSASVRAVFGESIRMEGKTIIPVARIAYGFGGGEGSVDSERAIEGEGGHGGGGGGGVAAMPVGVFEVTADQTVFVPVRNSRTRFVATLSAGFLIGLCLARLAR